MSGCGCQRAVTFVSKDMLQLGGFHTEMCCAIISFDRVDIKSVSSEVTWVVTNCLM